MTAVWRLEAPKLLGALARLVRDIDLAQDMAQEALLAALEHWPTAGIPVNPAAWLMTAAKNRALDENRRQKMMRAKHDEIQHTSAQFGAFDAEQLDVLVHDDVLRLMLISCHPVLPAESRLALTLRLVAGLSTAEIARALLSNEPAFAQRIVRAKRTIGEAKVPFELPAESELSARISPVLEVIYLIFNEGYAATRGDDLIRPELCDEALRLARILASLVPTEAEVHGLVSLMELQASRARARTDGNGEPLSLLVQNRLCWDSLQIERGLRALDRAQALRQPYGPYTLQAAIAACHARARKAEHTDWRRIVALYDALASLTASPVVELNRAVAVSMAYGPDQGLELLDELAAEGSLESYHLLYAARGDMREKLGRYLDACQDFERTAALTAQARESSFLMRRANDARALAKPAKH